MRARHELEAQYAAALRDQQFFAGHAQSFRDSAAGRVEALGWVLGERPAPITGTPPSPDGVTNAAVGKEEDLALDVLYRRADHGINYSYASGVEHALLWARGATEDPPVSA